jgi:hypothetical protein
VTFSSSLLKQLVAEFEDRTKQIWLDRHFACWPLGKPKKCFLVCIRVARFFVKERKGKYTKNTKWP